MPGKSLSSEFLMQRKKIFGTLPWIESNNPKEQVKQFPLLSAHHLIANLSEQDAAITTPYNPRI